MRLLPLLAALLLSIGVARAQSTSASMAATGTTCPLNCVVIPVGAGGGVIGAQTAGLQSSGATLTVEFSNDGGTTWNTGQALSGGALVSTVTGADGPLLLEGAGHTQVRLRVSSTGTGTIGIAFYPQVSSLDVFSRYYLSLLGTGAAKVITSPAAGTPQALAYTTVTSGSPVTVLGPSAPNAHGKGGWVGNCNTNGILYINDNGTAGLTQTGSNAALQPGQYYQVPPGTQNISVNASGGTLNICGEGQS